MGVHKSLVEMPQHVYSVVLFGVAQLKSTKTTTCSSAYVFACWATAKSSACVSLMFGQRFGQDGLHALHGRLTLTRLLQQRFQHSKLADLTANSLTKKKRFYR